MPTRVSIEPVVAEERKHHPYSPSTLSNREVCPSFKQKQSAHERAEAGTKAHNVVDTGEDDPTLSDEDAAAAAECMDFIESRRRILQHAADEAFKAEQERGTHPVPALFQIEELKEVELKIDDEKYPDADCTTGGFVDRVLIAHTRIYAELMDWKFGRHSVEPAATNVQGIAYTLGLFRKFPSLQGIRVFFKQPLIDQITEHLFQRSDIPLLYLRIKTIVERARAAHAANDFKEAKATVPGCLFCGEIGRCPKVRDFALRVGKKFMPIEFPESIEPSEIMDPKNTSQAIRLTQVLKVWCSAFKRQVTDRILRGEADIPPGYIMQTKYGAREIVDLPKFKQLCQQHLTEEEYQTCVSLDFTPVEKIISAKAPRGNKKNAVDEFKELLEREGAVKKGDQFSFLKTAGDEKEK